MLHLRQRWCVGDKAVPSRQMTGTDADRPKTTARAGTLCRRGACVLLHLLLCVMCPQGALSMRADTLLTAPSREGHTKQDLERPERPGGRSDAAGPCIAHAGMGHDASSRGAALSVGDASDEGATDSAGAGPYHWVAELDESPVQHGDERVESHASGGRKLKRWPR